MSEMHASVSAVEVPNEATDDLFAVDLAAADDDFHWNSEDSSPDIRRGAVLEDVDGVLQNACGVPDQCAQGDCKCVQDTVDVVHAGGTEASEEQVQRGDKEGVLLDGTSVDSAVKEKTKRASWRKLKEKVQSSVQIPLPGPFNRADLKWEVKCNQGNGKRRETQKATIPWNRLDDFLEGEMTSRQHPCTFVEVTRQCMKKDARKQVRAESAVQEIRYVIPSLSCSLFGRGCRLCSCLLSYV